MVDYIGIADIQRLIQQRGAAAFIEGLAAEIERDYRAGENSTNPRATPSIRPAA